MLHVLPRTTYNQWHEWGHATFLYCGAKIWKEGKGVGLQRGSKPQHPAAHDAKIQWCVVWLLKDRCRQKTREVPLRRRGALFKYLLAWHSKMMNYLKTPSSLQGENLRTFPFCQKVATWNAHICQQLALLIFIFCCKCFHLQTELTYLMHNCLYLIFHLIRGLFQWALVYIRESKNLKMLQQKVEHLLLSVDGSSFKDCFQKIWVPVYVQHRITCPVWTHCLPQSVVILNDCLGLVMLCF